MAAAPTRHRDAHGPRPDRRRLLELDEIADRLERVLELATPDETELAWIESVDGRTDDGARGPESTPVRRTVLIRAREGARRGAHRLGSGEPAEILNGVRLAVAASRASAPLPVAAGPWTEGKDPTPDDGAGSGTAGPTARAALWDPRIAELSPSAARDRVLDLLGPRHGRDRPERLSLRWTQLRVVVRTSEGVDRRAEATAITATAQAGAAGWAAASARSLDGLDPGRVLERARARARARGRRWATREPPTVPAESPILFSPEATASLVAVLVRNAFSSRAFEAERSPLAGLLGEHVFAPEIDLVDDGLAPAGLPFPFDLLGRPRRRIELVTGGVPRTPAVDESLAARLQRHPTPHALGPEDARPIHPFLLPRHSAEEVLDAAEGGLWIAGLDALECFDPGRVAVRARPLGARRVRGGALAEPVEGLVWEDSLLRLFSKVRAVGGEPVVLAEDGGMGGVSAPMVCAAGAEELTPSGAGG